VTKKKRQVTTPEANLGSLAAITGEERGRENVYHTSFSISRVKEKDGDQCGGRTIGPAREKKKKGPKRGEWLSSSDTIPRSHKEKGEKKKVSKKESREGCQKRGHVMMVRKEKKKSRKLEIAVRGKKTGQHEEKRKRHETECDTR